MKKRTHEYGTHEWATHAENFITGCGNDCLYGYCKEMAVRYGRSTSETWKNEKVREHDLTKKIKKWNSRILFPSSHDIRPEHLQENLIFLGNILQAGNEVLIVSKPHLLCIKEICKKFDKFKDNILFRFTIGSADDTVLKFWEPGAPSFKERLNALKWAYRHGFSTSISCEPMLDNNIDAVIKKVSPFVTETIWLGKISHLIGKNGGGRLDFNGHSDPVTLARAEQLIAWQSDENITQLYERYKNVPKIRWNESVKRVIRMTMITRITKVKEENGWLSCMSAHPVSFNGKTFKTCEALFQWLRFKGFPEIQQEIFIQKSPMGAKMKARLHRNLLDRGIKWDESPSDIPLMKMCLELKLEQHSFLKTALLNTGESIIIEDCTTHDRESARFWGQVLKDGKWVGENQFGKIWMEIRSDLLNQCK